MVLAGLDLLREIEREKEEAGINSECAIRPGAECLRQAEGLEGIKTLARARRPRRACGPVACGCVRYFGDLTT